MSMWQPLQPNLGRPDDGIPAADPGPGAPETADGFGIGGEDPDTIEQSGTAPDESSGADLPDDPPFRTPDPRDIGTGRSD